jgi:hypothetical protein
MCASHHWILCRGSWAFVCIVKNAMKSLIQLALKNSQSLNVLIFFEILRLICAFFLSVSQERFFVFFHSSDIAHLAVFVTRVVIVAFDVFCVALVVFCAAFAVFFSILAVSFAIHALCFLSSASFVLRMFSVLLMSSVSSMSLAESFVSLVQLLFSHNCRCYRCHFHCHQI